MPPHRNRLLALALLCVWTLTVPAAAPLGGDFALATSTGQTFNLSESRGKVVLMLFGYTHCPDVCPDTLARIKVLMNRLGAKADRVQALFVTVDPDRDTPKVLSNYVQYFGPHVLGLTGTREAIDRVVAQYHAQYRLLGNGNGNGYSVDHTAHLFVIDPQGKLARILPYGLPIDELVSAVQDLLKPGADTAPPNS